MSDWRKEVKKDSKFLYNFDIEGKTPLEVTIEGCATEKSYCPGKSKPGRDASGNFDDGKLDMWCLKFKGAKKMLGVNVTNGNLIEHVLGTADPAKWIGKKITLRTALCSKGGPCIRVHAVGAKLPKQCPKFQYTDKAS